MEPIEPRAGGLLASLTHHYDDLVGYVGRRFGDAEFARDVVHEVCADLLDRPEPAGVREALAAVILALPDRARQIFILHRLYDMPQAALASELGLSLNAVAKHYAVAVRRIRAQWIP